MNADTVTRIRKLTQEYAYTSLKMHETVGRKAGLYGTDHKYLGFLLVKGQMTAGELATISGLTTGAVTGLIDRFEKKKLVKRTFSDDDRRRVVIKPITKNIMALLKPLYKDYRGRSEKLIASFSDEEAKAIENYFLKAIELMKSATDKLNGK